MASSQMSHLCFPFFQHVAPLFSHASSELWQESFIRPKRISFRLNVMKVLSLSDVREFLPPSLIVRPVKGCADVFSIDSTHRQKLTYSEAVSRGLVYVQNPSSVLAARCLPLQPDDRVLDLASAPGGKTSVLAPQMDCQHGELWSIDSSRSRFFRLRANLECLGIHFVKVLRADGVSLRKRFENYFDKILLDAPCSGEARINGEEELRKWSLSAARSCRYKQMALMCAAFQMLRPGGLLLYVTCAVSSEENEAVIARFLKRHPSAALLPLSVPSPFCRGYVWSEKKWPSSLSSAIRIIPTEEYDCLFVCLIKKME